MSEHSENFASSSLDKSIRFFLWSIIISSVLIRGFLAWYVELGNDEVYYWTYALYPDWSHFDHPPMVGFFIWLTTLNLHFDSELFLRLSSVILGGVNICLVYRIGCKLKNCLTGLYATIFFTGSVYCFVITGIFIMPDTPQLFFWLLSLMILIHVLPDRQLTARSRQLLLLLGLTIGLAMLSKYTSAYLWVAIGIFYSLL
jgi:4-amino-4-deoxy-L-arabinose transferase-like glycosyltransferase